MAQASETVVNFKEALKVLYRQPRLDTIVYKDYPLLAMVPKDPNFFGQSDGYHITAKYGRASARSHTFDDAQTNRTTAKLGRFKLERKSDYAIFRLTNELIDASGNDMGALMQALKEGMDDAFGRLSRNLNRELWGNGGGARAQVGSDPSGGTTLTLKNKNDIVAFEVDDEVVVSADDGTSGSVRTGSATITGIDEENGQLETDSNWDTQIGSIAADDYIFIEGDFGKAITGLTGWIPQNSSDVGTLFGVDRTAHIARLAGHRHDGSSEPVEEALKSLAALIRRGTGRPDRGFANPIDLANLENALGTRVTYEMVQTRPTEKSGLIGFDSIKVTTGNGKVNMVSDPDCPQGTMWLLQMQTWVFAHLKALPHPTIQGSGFLDLDSADEREFRAVWRGQLGSAACGKNGRVEIQS